MHISLQTFLRDAPLAAIKAMTAQKGLSHRRAMNMLSRLNGIEPEPGPYAGIKRRMRYLRRH